VVKFLQTLNSDMLVDEYDMVDDKPEVAIITPAESSEEPEPEPMANDCQCLAPMLGVEI
jgi:hypothetical protein